STRPESHSGEGHLGLGLPIVRAIVESYGGRVECAPRHGAGASFTVTLFAAN
ncbi:MAG: ATP-binding protein, partial [Acidobacteria bacterium]|nr:ATP-binding protein [Acidobacteriota bacterium]